MICWSFNPDYADTPAADSFSTLAATFSVQGTWVTSDPESLVLRTHLGERCYYIKRYFGGGRSLARRWFGLRNLFGAQRVRKEWENLLAFRRWQIPTATLVAYGEERRWGFFSRGALVTEELPDTTDLAHLALQHDSRLRDRAWVAHVSKQLAGYARSMHAAGFAHNDFKWRNVLVGQGQRPTVFLIDCPNGRTWWRPFLAYRVIKDLACLDKVAKYHLSKTQRLRFYLDYAQRARLSAVDKQKIRKILDFFAGRE